MAPVAPVVTGHKRKTSSLVRCWTLSDRTSPPITLLILIVCTKLHLCMSFSAWNRAHHRFVFFFAGDFLHGIGHTHRFVAGDFQGMAGNVVLCCQPLQRRFSYQAPQLWWRFHYGCMVIDAANPWITSALYLAGIWHISVCLFSSEEKAGTLLFV